MMFLYHLFVRWNILPGRFYGMQPGEQALIRAFVMRFLEGEEK